MKYRGLIHFHSSLSFDSCLSVKAIVNFALKNNLNFLILTDHNSIEGSLRLRRYIESRELDILVIPAAEYATEFGDVIAVGIHSEITNMKFIDFARDVKSQGGVLLFPHPYDAHKNIEKIAQACDLIEVFNARSSDRNNLLSARLAEDLHKPIYYATDAHCAQSLQNSIIEFFGEKDFMSSLVSSKIYQATKIKSFRYEIIYSQIIKSIKLKNLRLFIYQIKNLLISVIKLKILEKV